MSHIIGQMGETVTSYIQKQEGKKINHQRHCVLVGLVSSAEFHFFTLRL